MAEVIHIGYPKTATTWFQDEYFPKVENFHFESWKVVNRYFLLSDSFLFEAEKTRIELNPKNKYTNLLFSSEFLTTAINFGWHGGNYSIASAQKLKETYPQAVIVIFLRRQQSLICSAYQQYIKNGGTFSFKKWLYSGEVFSFEHLLFDKLIALYDSLFGEENVKIYLYEDFRENSEHFLETFNANLGFIVDMSSISLKPINKGLRKGVIPIQRFLNLFYRKPIGRKHFIVHVPGMTSVARQVMKRINRCSIFGGFLSEKNMLSVNDIDYIRKFYSKSNANLANRLGFDAIKKHGYYLD
ncbi:MAG: hypothetical protein AB7S48_07880 [Bacteroidales bacterium]